MNLRTYHCEQYASVGAFLDTVESWGRETFPQAHGADSSLTNGEEFAGPPLFDAIHDMRTCTGHVAETITIVEALVAELTERMPMGTDYRRTRTWGPSGSAINPHRVLRGQLRTAWRKTQRSPQLTDQGVLTLCLPASYPGVTGDNTILWTMATTIALAHALERQGRRVELWSLAACRNAFGGAASPTDFLAAIRLKAADAPWSLQEAVLPLSRAWLRRLHFRLLEHAGVKDTGHGHALGQADWEALCRAYLAEQGIPTDTVIFGPSVEHGIAHQASALRWLKAAITPED